MKYIRTKDGKIFDIQPHTISSFCASHFFIFDKNELWEKYLKEYEENGICYYIHQYRFVGFIEKQANTIEELCDEFMVYQPWTHTRYIADKNVVEAIKMNIEINYYKNVGYDLPFVQGFVWTYKGLIYVAKMNAKGELELL